MDDFLALLSSSVKTTAGNDRFFWPTVPVQQEGSSKFVEYLKEVHIQAHHTQASDAPKDGVRRDRLGSHTKSNILVFFESHSSLMTDNVADRLCLDALKNILENDHVLRCCSETPMDIPEESIPSEHLLSLEKIMLIKALILVIHHLAHVNKLNADNLFTECCNLVDVPLEVLWLLHSGNIVDFSSYLARNSRNETTLQYIKKGLKSVILSGSRDERAETLICDFFSILITALYATDSSFASFANLQQQFTSILFHITEASIDVLLDEKGGRKPMNYFQILLKSGSIDGVALRNFFSDQLELILCYKPDSTITEALKFQEDWTYGKSPGSLIEVFKKLLVVFSPEEYLESLKTLLEKGDLNWKNVLIWISTYLLVVKEAPQLLKGFVSELLSESFAEHNQKKFLQALLIARQCSAEGTHIFGSYANWFSKTFGSEVHTPVTTPAAFQFLMDTLTLIVPVEPAYCLKVHINKVPFTPRGCHTVLAEYVTLVRTKLSDLEETTHHCGLYELPVTISQRTVKQSEYDVERVLSHFEKTSEIPRIVLEASVFRKNYYETDFLSELLKPRILPKTPDCRMQFIERLKEAKKIPASLYSKYKDKCLNFMDAEVTGQSSSTNDGDVALNAVNDLSIALGKLVDVIEGKIDDFTVNELLSRVTVQLNVILEEDLRAMDTSVFESSDLLRRGSPLPEQVMDSFLCSFSECLLKCKDKPTSWAYQYIMVLNSSPELQRVLYRRLLEWVIFDYASSSDEQLNVAALLLHTLLYCKAIFCQVIHEFTTPEPFACYLCSLLPCKNKKEMEHTLKFSEMFFRYGELYFKAFPEARVCPDNFAPEVMLKKYLFINERFHHSSSPTHFTSSITTNSNIWLEVTQNIKVSVEEWLDWEFCIIGSEDIFTSSYRRQEYIFNTLTADFLQVQSKDKYGFPVSSIVTLMLNRLLKQETFYGPEFLLAVQRLVTYRELQGHEAFPPWLLKQWQDIHSQHGNAPLAVRTTDEDFFRIAVNFPPWMLLANKLMGRLNLDVLQAIIVLINNHLSKTLCEKGFLQFSFTQYLTSAVCMMSTSEDFTKEDVFSMLLQQCPSYRLSFLAYYAMLQSSITDVSEQEEKISSRYKRIGTSIGLTVCTSESSIQEVHPGCEQWEVVLLTTSFLRNLTKQWTFHCGSANSASQSLAFRSWIFFYDVLELVSALADGQFDFDGLKSPVFGRGSPAVSLYVSLQKRLENNPAFLEVLDAVDVKDKEPYKFLNVECRCVMAAIILQLVCNVTIQNKNIFRQNSPLLFRVLLSNHTIWMQCSMSRMTDVYNKVVRSKLLNLRCLSELTDHICNLLQACLIHDVCAIPTQYIDEADSKIQAVISRKRSV